MANPKVETIAAAKENGLLDVLKELGEKFGRFDSLVIEKKQGDRFEAIAGYKTTTLMIHNIHKLPTASLLKSRELKFVYQMGSDVIFLPFESSDIVNIKTYQSYLPTVNTHIKRIVPSTGY